MSRSPRRQRSVSHRNTRCVPVAFGPDIQVLKRSPRPCGERSTALPAWELRVGDRELSLAPAPRGVFVQFGREELDEARIFAEIGNLGPGEGSAAARTGRPRLGKQYRTST